MFTINNSADFLPSATITKAVNDDLFVWDNIRYFDNDGFQLSKLEQEYYKANGIPLEYINGVWGAQTEWITSDDPILIIDHSMLITRCKYEGEALEQLHRWSEKFPYLVKYLSLIHI